MKDSARPYAVVDLFAGPGGLGEGFAAYGKSEGGARYQTVLSVENDRDAYQTLLLRSLLRKFEGGFPDEYYRFLNGESAEPDWEELAPDQWREAAAETKCLELGSPQANDFLEARIAGIRNDWGDRTILIGGPPCQAYSVVGRVRNGGDPSYDPEEDGRYRLYRQYINVLAELRPAVAVMENVKGLLSARLNGDRIFDLVLSGLRFPGNDLRYRTYGLCPRSGSASLLGYDCDGADFVVRAEEHGVPQARHRVFVVCIRDDIAEDLPRGLQPNLDPTAGRVSLSDVIGTMPRLRSRLSRGDSPEAWRGVVRGACGDLQDLAEFTDSESAPACQSALSAALKALDIETPPTEGGIGSTTISSNCPQALRSWLADDRITRLPNNEARSHMPADLVRYLFAAVFASAFGRSPKTRDFPPELAAKHRNWSSGSFDDRFRVQVGDCPATTVTSHLAKDGHYFIHPDVTQVRSLTVREAARVQTFPDNYLFRGSRTSQYVQVGNAVPPFLALQIAQSVWELLARRDRSQGPTRSAGRYVRREPVPMAAAAMAAR